MSRPRRKTRSEDTLPSILPLLRQYKVPSSANVFHVSLPIILDQSIAIILEKLIPDDEEWRSHVFNEVGGRQVLHISLTETIDGIPENIQEIVDEIKELISKARISKSIKVSTTVQVLTNPKGTREFLVIYLGQKNNLYKLVESLNLIMERFNLQQLDPEKLHLTIASRPINSTTATSSGPTSPTGPSSTISTSSTARSQKSRKPVDLPELFDVEIRYNGIIDSIPL